MIKKVRVRINGGISIISAFSNGLGGAASIDLPMEITMTESASDSSDQVIRKTISFIEKRLNLSGSYSVHVESRIPVSAGLKSSSALTLGIILGMISINDLHLDDVQILKEAALASIANGTSLTGAFDDLCSCLYGGYCITDNRKMEILARGQIPEYPVMIAYPQGIGRTTSGISLENFSHYSACFDRIFRQAMDGNVLEAMDLNGFVMGSILGIDLMAIGSLLRMGSGHASQSGKGPAIYGVFEKGIPRGVKLFTGYGRVQTRFSNRRADVKEVS
ncbi:MAG: shikimate kinase [Thermoplasmata archaeon]